MAVNLKRFGERKLIQWILGYCAAAWVALQVMDFLAGQFGWHPRLLPTLTVVLGCGIAIVAVLAWFHGEKGAQHISVLEIGLLAGLTLAAAGGGTWAFRRDEAAAATSHAAKAATTDASLFVTPFRNLSEDPQQKVFSDGFTDELSSAVQNINGLRVLASSAFLFDGTEQDLDKLLRDIHPDLLLTGGVRRSGDRVRITAQLIESHSKRQMWADAYESALTPANVLSVQQEIAAAIVRALKLKLEPGGARLPSGTSNQEAHDEYLAGLSALALVTYDSYEQARQHFERAVELDPNFARAWSGLGFSLCGWYCPQATASAHDAVWRKARHAAEKALELDSTLAEPHVTLSLMLDARHKRLELDRAKQLEPTARWPRYFSASWYLQVGDRVSAFADVDTLLAVDPVSPWSHIMAANLRNLGGDYVGSEAAAKRALKLIELKWGPEPDWALYWNIGYTAVVKRDWKTAGENLPKAAALLGGRSRRFVAPTRELFEQLQKTEESSSTPGARRAAQLAAVRKYQDRIQGQFAAMLLLSLGDKEGMYRFMEKQPRAIFWPVAFYDEVRNEARFRALAAAQQMK